MFGSIPFEPLSQFVEIGETNDLTVSYSAESGDHITLHICAQSDKSVIEAIVTDDEADATAEIELSEPSEIRRLAQELQTAAEWMEQYDE